MDIVKYIYQEISCFLKAGYDISSQKLQQIFTRTGTGL